MNPEKQEFENLRRLLKLKRYEQPPPRYFNDFSSQVVSRLKAGESKGGYESLSQAAWEVPWLQRLLERFERKPVLAGVFGAAICGLLVGGAVYSEIGDAAVATTEPMPPVLATPTPAVAAAFGQSTPASLSTNPASLFDMINSQAMPASQNVMGRPLGQGQ